MKTIDSIIIHCSATKAGQDIRAKDIDLMHKQRGFSQIGYNFVIDLDGTEKMVGHYPLTERIVTQKAFPVLVIINTVSVSATSVGLM